MIKNSLVISCIVFVLLDNGAEGSTYHIALLGTSDAASVQRSAFLNYKQSGGSQPNVSSAMTSCVAKFSSADTQAIKVANLTCDELFIVVNGVSNNGIKVEMVDSLHVYSEYAGTKQDGFMAIADEHLGNEYYVVTYCSTGGYCQFAVVGTENGTNVNIVFPRNVTIKNDCVNNLDLNKRAPDGSLVSITLNENNVFYYESQEDLSGTYIQSDKVVSVFVGARNIPAGSGTMSSLVEQIPPTSKWGNHFIVAPFHLNYAGDVIKIISESSHNEVYMRGFSPFTIDKMGQSVERRIDWRMYGEIETSKPALIIQMFSVDLYNTTTPLSGRPAMSIIMHTQQLGLHGIESRCDETDWYSVLTFTKMSIATFSTTSQYLKAAGVLFQHVEPLPDDNYEVVVLLQPNNVINISTQGVNKGGYSYCGMTMAMPLNANWDWENQGCLESAAYPGDGIDNDCDGEIDEHNCSEEELGTMISVEESPDMENVTYNWTNIRGAVHLDLRVKSCATVVFKLYTDKFPQFSLTIMINPSFLWISCVPTCSEPSEGQHSVYNCSEERRYKLEWYREGDDLIHHIKQKFEDYNTIKFTASNIPIESYDKLMMTGLGGQAIVTIDLAQKDCAQNKERGDTMFGRNFVVPTQRAPQFDIIITAIDANTSITVTESTSQFEVPAMSSIVITQNNFTSKHNLTEIRSEDADIAVYFTTNLDDVFKGMHIYPKNVVSNVYQLRSLATQGTCCYAYPTLRAAVTNIGTKFAFSNNDIDVDDYDSLGYRRLLKSDRPMAVFCKTEAHSLTQLNPTETFGRRFYIPPINLYSINAEGIVTVIASEDSTVIVYKELYDEMKMLEKTGDEYQRVLRNLTTVIDISSSKPVQVLLHLRIGYTSTFNPWVSDIYIPSVEQYTYIHYFPAFRFPFGYTELLHTNAVDESGDIVASGVSLPSDKVQNVTFSAPTFSITCLKTSHSQVVVISSHHLLKTINQDCTLTQDQPGDGVDGDCDGLIDEEECSLYNLDNTSFIDTDLDGNLNKDCTNDTTAPIATGFSAIVDTAPCLNFSQSINITENNDAVQKITFDELNTPVINGSAMDIPPLPVDPSSPPIVAPVPVPDNPIPLPDLDEVTANLTAETCVTACSCPCGWVLPEANYTMEEIQMLVLQLQRHLRVSKPSLSVTIRKKTSAEDNRPTAVAVGYMALVALLGMIASVVLLDVSTLFRDIRQLIKTVRSIVTKRKH